MISRTVFHFGCRLWVVIALLMSVPAMAADVVLDAAAVKRFGVVLSQPAPAQSAVVASGEGYVVAPPASERIIATLSAGLVNQVLVSTGDRVSAGETLVLLSGSHFLEMQRGYLGAMREAALAEQQLDRDAALHEEGIISDRRFHESTNVHAQAQLSKEQFALELAYAGMSQTAIDELTSSGKLKRTLALTAPRSGTITEVYVRPGEQLDADTPVARLVNLERLMLEIRLTRFAAASISPGMSARLAATQQHLGKVINVLPIVDAHNQTVLIRVALATDAQAPLGAFVSAELLSDHPDSPLWKIPLNALMRNETSAQVFLLDQGLLRMRPVTVIGESGTDAWVRGLSADDQLVVKGIAALKAVWTSATTVAGEDL